MSSTPFGFGTGGSDDLSGKIPLFAEIEKLMSWSGGPVNWDLARQVAIKAASEGDRTVTADEAAAVADAIRLADVWLDAVTALPSGATHLDAWSRVGWVEATLPVWQTLCDPVAAKVGDTVQASLSQGLQSLGEGGLPDQLELPEGISLPEGFEMPSGPELAAMMGPMLGVMKQVGSLMFGAQIGQALGSLAGEVLGSTDIGLPLGPDGRAALLPLNVLEFGEGLDVGLDEVRIYLALREAAHQRLFAHVPWLRAHLLGAVDDYARGIEVDPEAITQALQSVDPTDPESLQQAMGGGLFDVEPTPAQQATLDRLGTLLALVEGWVDAVVDSAASGHLPSADALRETVRRRRATGGPAEQTFASLVGLELRPRRLREAAALWTSLAQARGIDGRDALWAHPDLMPGSDDLDHPDTFVHGTSGGSDGWDMQSLESAPEAPPEQQPPGPEAT